MTDLRSCLYLGHVYHARLRPKRHRLRYAVFYGLFDLDELPALSARCRLFSHNRFNVFSFRDRDHGPGVDAPLRPWIEGELARAGIAADGGRILALCLPRMLGYVFNPLTVYFCHDKADRLVAILYEVSNTFGERHCYLMPVAAPEARAVVQSAPKRFYVSPFLGNSGTYHFKVLRPGARMSLVIRECDDEGPLLTASFAGARRSMSDGTLAGVFVRYPLLTLKVVAGIHWEALKLFLKGVRLYPRPKPPRAAVTIGTAGNRLTKP